MPVHAGTCKRTAPSSSAAAFLMLLSAPHQVLVLKSIRNGAVKSIRNAAADAAAAFLMLLSAPHQAKSKCRGRRLAA
jgi:hypothetical protein